ncbi:MAG: hypothetical protein VX482_04325, partial [Candidatus Thermoplasmatota archaeon]|nr:hypothetical protein [Candidatus Thermoplasmatota archaeon]MEC9351340.1 hypothetical protein [Candidatus Thermoplasmatota archaeon]
MNIESMISEVLPTMIWAWVSVGLFILGIQAAIKAYRWWYNLAKKAASPNRAGTLDQVMDRLSPLNRMKRWYQTFKSRWLAAPHNISMALKSAWRARERGLAIFAGVFLSSLVITTVLAYAVGLNQGFFQFSLEGEVFDAKLDFQKDPGGTWDGRTNNSELWESFCDDLTSMEEFSDCSIVYGRQGIRVTGFFDES